MAESNLSESERRWRAIWIGMMVTPVVLCATGLLVNRRDDVRRHEFETKLKAGMSREQVVALGSRFGFRLVLGADQAGGMLLTDQGSDLLPSNGYYCHFDSAGLRRVDGERYWFVEEWPMDVNLHSD